MKAHFLVTHDVHSHLESFVRASALMEHLRAQWLDSGEQVYLIDLGDHMDRAHPTTEGTLGMANAHFLKALGYQLWTFGNNEGLTIPTRLWKSLADTVGVLPLIANFSRIDSEQAMEFQWESTRIVEIGDLRIGFIGITANYQEYYKLVGLTLEDPMQSVKRLLPSVREQGCDFIVILSHCGLPFDRHLARTVPGIDLILGSHTHNVLPDGELVGQTLICQGGKYARYIVHIELDSDQLKNGIQDPFRMELLQVPESIDQDDRLYEGAAKYQALLDEWNERARQALEQVIGRISGVYPHSVIEMSAMAKWVVDRIREEDGVDVAVINQGLLGKGFTSEAVTLADLHQACPGPINMVRGTISGSGLQTLAESALNPDIAHRHGVGFGFRGKEIGILQFSGLEQKIIDGKPCLWVGDLPLQAEREYTVSVPDYLLFSKVFPGSEQIRPLAIDPLFLRERMAGWVVKIS